MSQCAIHDPLILDLTLDYLDRNSHLVEHFYFVFDLDSTLFDVSPRTQEILRHFAEAQARQLPDLADALRQVVIKRSDWHLAEALQRHAINLSSDLLTDLEQFWHLRFFSNDYLHLDAPIEGAVEYVQRLHQRGVKIIYLTGRDQIRMAEGTWQSLLRHGFPIQGSQARLALKPHSNLKDETFKADYLRTLAQTAQKIWFFENEPVNIQGLKEAHPNLEVIFFASTHSGRLPPPQNVPYITHFQLKGSGRR